VHTAGRRDSTRLLLVSRGRLRHLKRYICLTTNLMVAPRRSSVTAKFSRGLTCLSVITMDERREAPRTPCA
jgi:hypothetical protein